MKNVIFPKAFLQQWKAAKRVSPLKPCIKNVSADYFILGKNNDFKTDTALELLNSLDDFSRESAMQILNQYVIAINNVRSRNDSAKKPQT